MLTAIEKVRKSLTGSIYGEPHFQHEGDDVVRWITGGSAADACVAFKQCDSATIVTCPSCGEVFGTIDYGKETYKQLGDIRRKGAEHALTH